jgi:hypothetical protein
MRVLTAATVHEDRVPSWDAVRSILARGETLMRQQVAEDVKRGLDEQWARMEQQVERRVTERLKDTEREALDARRLREQVTELGAALGVYINPQDTHWGIPLPQLAEAVRLIEHHASVERAVREVTASHLTAEVKRAVTSAQGLLADLEAAAGSLPEPGRLT